MSVTYIPVSLRRRVITRAGRKCEYCLLREATVFYGCEIDHIISEKHGGSTTAANLAYSCFYCNRNRGSDIATRDMATGAFVGFFNPRTDVWADHFAFSAMDSVTFIARTAVAEATIRIFGINDIDRVWERLILHGTGRYPQKKGARRLTRDMFNGTFDLLTPFMPSRILWQGDKGKSMATTEHMVSEGGIVIFNPTAGRGRGAALRDAAQAQLGPDWEWRPTLRAGHAVELARQAATEKETVVAFGGDGTVGDVMRGIHGTEATLGIIPAGTGNDVARNLKIPLDLKEACLTVMAGVVRRIDVGTINGTPFINNAGTGFDAHVMNTMNSSIRFTKGQPAFILATLKTLPGFQPFTLTMTVDDKEPETFKAMLVSVLNGTMYGGGMLAAPLAEVDDGMLNVMVIKPMAKAKLVLDLMPKVIAGKHENHPAIQLFTARKLTLTTTPKQPLNIDGDVRGTTPAEIGVLSRALKVLVR